MRGAAAGTAVETLEIGRLVLRNPLIAAAGCIGYGLEAAEQSAIDGLGALVTSGTTLTARSGSPAPRMIEVPAGLLHAIGHQNPGISVVLDRFAPRWSRWRVAVILSLAGATADDYRTLASRVDVPGVAGIEIDLASVDLARGGRPISMDVSAAARATASARAAAADLPLIVKLSPAAGDVRRLTRAVVEAGADALTCGGGLPAAAFDRGPGRPVLGSDTGTLSGPAIRTVAMRMVAEASAAVKVPIIGCGGVSALPDVLEMLAAGASAVQVGTAMLADPQLPARLALELASDRQPERSA